MAEIDWAALLRVAVLSAAIAVAVVTMFSIGVLGVQRIDASVEAGNRVDRRRVTGWAIAGGAHGLCILAVLFGLYLIVPLFH